MIPGGKRTRTVPLVVFLMLHGACAVHYSRAQREELVTTEGQTEISHRLSTNEILATDSSGLVCAGIATHTSAYGNAMSAVREARREGKREVEFTYRRASPAQFAGIQCGAYYKWGGGTSAIYDLSGGERPRDVVGDTKLSEIGLHFEGSEQLLDSFEDLFWTARFRLGGGEVSEESGPELLDGTRLLFPFEAGLLYAPAVLVGGGVKAHVGYDVMNLVTEVGDASEKFNYGASGFYRATVGRFGFGAEVGWRHESVGTYDPGTWIEADDVFGTAWFVYDFR